MEKDFESDFLLKEAEGDLPPVIMVDRGGCTFVTKVRNIEKLGIQMALIADDQVENIEYLIMADDGSGHRINIPSFIIMKNDADHIKTTIARNDTVYLKAVLEMVHPDNRVEYEFWYSTIFDVEYWRLYDIALYQKALNKDALFTPRIITQSCLLCSDEEKKSKCVVDGLYCPKEPLPEKLKGVSQLDLLEELLRQKCLYHELTYNKKDSEINSNFTKWFNYVLNFIEQCRDVQSFDGNCSQKVMKELKIDNN